MPSLWMDKTLSTHAELAVRASPLSSAALPPGLSVPRFLLAFSTRWNR